MVRTKQLKPAQVDRPSWDDFCAQHNASFLCLSNNFVFPFGSRVKLFEFFEERSSRKIAQCAVRLTGQGVRFLDSLVIDRRFQDAAHDCLAEVVQRLRRAGTMFCYGSPWNMQGPMTTALESIDGLTLMAERPYVVDAVDLRDRESPHSFLKTLGSSHRRNIRKAEAAAETIRLRKTDGLACLAQLRTMNRLRYATYTRKQLPFGGTRSLLSMARKAICFGRRAFVTTVEMNGDCLGGVFGVKHDKSFFYVHGGNLPNKLGLSHWQHWSLIRECLASERDFYVMGYAYSNDVESPQLVAQRTFKKRFRCTEFPGSVVALKAA